MEGQQTPGKKRKKSSIILEIALLFVVSILATGILAYVSQRIVNNASVEQEAEEFAAGIARDTEQAVKDYPNYRWLMRYWHDHADELVLEYDVEYRKWTKTVEKAREWNERHPNMPLRYVDYWDANQLSEEDQKLYAEIIYSWMITRINEIKRTNNVDFLFVCLTDDKYDSQFFLLSGADEGATRGTQFTEVYTLGVFKEIDPGRQEAMREARKNSNHLTHADEYVDYYHYLGTVDDYNALVGVTFNQNNLSKTIESQTRYATAFAVLYQVILAIVCLVLLLLFVIKPLKKVQENIRLYKTTKNSKAVLAGLSEVKANNEIGQLSDDVGDLTKAIDAYTSEIATITAEKQRIGTELELASRIQASMLPSTFPAFPEKAEFDIYASMTPAKEVGGDFYDFFFVDEDHLCITIADISGKGIPAALFMMASKIILANNAAMGKSPAQILTDTNEAICANNEEEMFVTVWLGILELSTGKLMAANAGHEYPALMKAGGQFELYKDKHGFVVGGMAGMQYKEYEIMMEPGATLFVYTDGVPEATNAEKELFGTDRMVEALNKDVHASPEQFLDNVKEAVDGFVKEAEQFDDLTMLCITYKGPNKT